MLTHCFNGAPGAIRTSDPLVRRISKFTFLINYQCPTTLAIFIAKFHKALNIRQSAISSYDFATSALCRQWTLV